MQKTIAIFFSLLLGPVLPALGCDFCTLGQGLNPYLTASGVGITLDSNFTTSNAIYNRNSTIDSNGKKESWLVYTLTGFYPVTDELFVLLAVPFAMKNNLDYEASTNTNPGSTTSGIGDVALTGRYTVSKFHTLESTWQNGFVFGVKFPTGSVDARDRQGRFLDRHVQLGTGSFDTNLGFSSSLASAKGYLLTADLVYGLAGPGHWGDRNHRFGDSLNASLKGFYKVTPIERVENSVYLMTGPILQSSGKEKGVQSDTGYDSQIVNESSGGIVLFWDFGVYLPLNQKTIFNFSFAKAFYHDMNQSLLFDADPAEDYKIDISMTYLF